MSCAWPRSCDSRPLRPEACRRARSSWSCTSLSSKSSRSRVAACSMSRMLAVFAKRSPSSDSRSETRRPTTSESTARASSRPRKVRSGRRCPLASQPAEVGRCSRHLGEVQDLVDDPLADEERRHRQQRPQEPQEERREGETGVDLPDQAEKRTEISERREALTQRPRCPAIGGMARMARAAPQCPPRRMLPSRRVLPGCTASASRVHLTSAARTPMKKKGPLRRAAPLSPEATCRGYGATLLQRSVPKPKLLA